MKTKIVLKPLEEFAFIMWIVFYDFCTIEIFEIIKNTLIRLNIRKTGIVYRGQTNDKILSDTKFFTTSPSQRMAKLFQPTDWESIPKNRPGY